MDRLRRRRRSLSDDALFVVLEWGPAMRLPEVWRLQQRQPTVPATSCEAALAEAHSVTHMAYELTTEAWPRDRREDPKEVDRVSKAAVAKMIERYPDLDPASLRRAINQANYTHAK